MASLWDHQAEAIVRDTRDDTLTQDSLDVVQDIKAGHEPSGKASSFAPAYLSSSSTNHGDSLGNPSWDPKLYQLPLRQRRQTIAQSTWDHYRPIIEDLYIHQQLELKEVIAKMKREHGFDAT